MGQRSGDYRRAFKDGGGEKECGSWGNALRQYHAAVASSGSAAEAQPQQPKTPPQRQAAAASAAGSAAGASTGATTATRTGTLQAPNVRATSQQAAKLQAGKGRLLEGGNSRGREAGLRTAHGGHQASGHRRALRQDRYSRRTCVTPIKPYVHVSCVVVERKRRKARPQSARVASRRRAARHEPNVSNVRVTVGAGLLRGVAFFRRQRAAQLRAVIRSLETSVKGLVWRPSHLINASRELTDASQVEPVRGHGVRRPVAACRVGI